MKVYEIPEVFELGDAETVTLASLTSKPADKCGACQGTSLVEEDDCPEEVS